MSSVSYYMLERRAREIATATGKSCDDILPALLNAHRDRGIEIHFFVPPTYEKDLNFSTAFGPMPAT